MRYQALAQARFPDACTPRIEQGTTDRGTAAWAWRGEHICLIELAPDFWTDRYTDATRCTVIIHEYGHLSLIPHSEDPADIMYWMPQADPMCVNQVKSSVRAAPRANERDHFSLRGDRRLRFGG